MAESCRVRVSREAWLAASVAWLAWLVASSARLLYARWFESCSASGPGDSYDQAILNQLCLLYAKAAQATLLALVDLDEYTRLHAISNAPS